MSRKIRIKNVNYSTFNKSLNCENKYLYLGSFDQSVKWRICNWFSFQVFVVLQSVHLDFVLFNLGQLHYRLLLSVPSTSSPTSSWTSRSRRSRISSRWIFNDFNRRIQFQFIFRSWRLWCVCFNGGQSWLFFVITS